MPTLCTYDYALVRVVPHVDRGEFVNAGVIVACASKGFLKARMELDEARLLALDPGADIVSIQAAHSPDQAVLSEQLWLPPAITIVQDLADERGALIRIAAKLPVGEEEKAVGRTVAARRQVLQHVLRQRHPLRLARRRR